MNVFQTADAANAAAKSLGISGRHPSSFHFQRAMSGRRKWVIRSPVERSMTMTAIAVVRPHFWASWSGNSTIAQMPMASMAPQPQAWKST